MIDRDQLLASIRLLLERGSLMIASGDGKPSFSESLLFFGAIDPRVVRERYAAALRGEAPAEWFLVTDKPHGREWLDELEGAGLLVAGVEDLASIQSELESYAAPPLERLEDLVPKLMKLGTIAAKKSPKPENVVKGLAGGGVITAEAYERATKRALAGLKR